VLERLLFFYKKKDISIMIKYQISPYYKFIKPSQLVNIEMESVEEIQKIKNEELFLLYNKHRGEKLLVNSVIHTFLSHCNQPVSFETLLRRLAKQFGEKTSDVKPIVEDFLDTMLSKRIIFDAEHVKAIKNYIKSSDNVLEPLKKGTVLDHYVLTKLLSIHIPIEVHLAENMQTNETVILKLLRIEADLDENTKQDMIKNFSQEFKLMEKLKGHPNICALVEHSEGQHIYGALEFIEAISVRKRIEEIKPMPSLEKRLDWYAQTLNAFAHIHHAGIVHGDVHTSNILLRNNSEIKIIDFDMAFHVELQEDENVVYGGAFEFIAPEKININAFHIAKESADLHSEVYQLGLVGYFLLFGKLPFKGLTWEELAQNIMQNEIDFTTENCEITSQMIDFVKKALQKNPNARFNDALDMKAHWSIVLSEMNEVVIA
jgi:eukaryotic-like serine/threonine-protein kinase